MMIRWSIIGRYFYYPSCHRDEQSASLTAASVSGGGSFPSIDLTRVVVTTECIDLHQLITISTTGNNAASASFQLPGHDSKKPRHHRRH
jgi:hypothetical protein